MESKIKILTKLNKVQEEIKVLKDKNAMGRYNYRSAEDILTEVKPLLKKYKLVLVVDDEIIHFQDEGVSIYQGLDRKGEKETKKESLSRYYIKATATLYDIESGEFIFSSANAREVHEKLGMDGAQLTGSSSSYARKYALSGLLCLDDNRDIDEK